MKTLKKFILISTLLISGFSTAQNVEFKRSNFKDDTDAYKEATDAIDKGTTLFEEGSLAIFEVRDPGLTFKKALIEFEIAQKLNPENALNNYRIGVCYIHSSTPYKAIPFLDKAYALDPVADPFLYYYHGNAKQLEEKFDEALVSYKKFEENYRKSDNFNKFVTMRKKECGYAKKFKAEPVRVWVDNVQALNTEFDEIAPTITTDGAEIIFSSNRPNENKPNVVGDFDHDIYSSFNNDGTWQKAKPISGSVNSTLDDIVNNLSYDGTKMLLHKDNEGQIDIYETILMGSNWSTPEIMHHQISTKRTNDMYASYNHDGYNIFFARGNENLSKGTNIMYAGKQSLMDKSYSTATTINQVNSQFNDGPIYMHIDGKTMYIASQGHESIGGYDIFVSKKTQGGWSKPENMGYPINTPYDDFFFAATANGKYAYISSNRPNGQGGFDIYKVTFWGAPKHPIVDMEDYLLASIAEPIKDPQIEEVVSVNKVSLTVFKGKTIDALTRKAVEASIEITDNKNGKIIERFTTNSATGKFLLSLTAGKNYGIAVKADGYLFHSENFDVPEGSDYNLIDKTINLKNIAVGSRIALRNIFFDVGESILRSESNAELDRLVNLLKEVPTLKVEISGHTDNTGSATINDKLSQDRADAVVVYLKGKGISADRLTSQGYGASKPISSNNSSQGRQENRRTEFEITAN
ncbi:OmpA family protein [Brumimicrobium mesophilum]|uniref:OmpA family protein n=1 Tax=Brumimicrobium mesophilum TaxID=392717 RepID=UPI000D13F709|nr:OmpA family protein [Brumimicrobium mesophilum]